MYFYIRSIENFCKRNKKDFSFSKVIFFPSWSEELSHRTNNETSTLIRFEKDSFNIVFAGNIGQAQDFESVLKAARELRPKTHKVDFFRRRKSFS